MAKGDVTKCCPAIISYSNVTVTVQDTKKATRSNPSHHNFISPATQNAFCQIHAHAPNEENLTGATEKIIRSVVAKCCTCQIKRNHLPNTLFSSFCPHPIVTELIEYIQWTAGEWRRTRLRRPTLLNPQTRYALGKKPSLLCNTAALLYNSFLQHHPTTPLYNTALHHYSTTLLTTLYTFFVRLSPTQHCHTLLQHPPATLVCSPFPWHYSTTLFSNITHLQHP